MAYLSVKRCKFFCKQILFIIFVFAFWNVLVMRASNDETKTSRVQTKDDPKFLARLRGLQTSDSLSATKILLRNSIDPPSKKKYTLMEDKNTPEAKLYNKFHTNFQSFIRCKEILQRFFNNSPPGFFIESGAMDGEFLSNSLYLEKTLGWTGLLIEPDANTYRSLLRKNRNSWSSNTCISNRNYPKNVSFITYSTGHSNILQEMLTRSTSNVEGIPPPAAGQMGVRQEPRNVQCFPLASYIKMLNLTDVDYISLDVEGAEAEILLSFPWSELNVTVWSIEHRILNNYFKHFMTRRNNEKSSNHASAILETLGESNDPLENTTSYSVHSNDTMEVVVKHEKKVVYVNGSDPHEGQDPYFIDFMKEKGYHMVDYWDGDYTFVLKNSLLFQKIENGEI